MGHEAQEGAGPELSLLVLAHRAPMACSMASVISLIDGSKGLASTRQGHIDHAANSALRLSLGDIPSEASNVESRAGPTVSVGRLGLSVAI